MVLKRILLFIFAAFLFAAATRTGGDNLYGAGQAQLLNDRSQQIIGADLLSAPGFVTPAGLTGRDQVVAVADSGIDKGSMEDVHPDLAGQPGKKPKIIMLRSWAGRQAADDPVGHGTHMAGTIAGNGSASGGKFRGVAPEANIYFQGILDPDGKIAPPADVDKLFLPAYLAGARIHVNAWGSGANIYSGSAMKADAFMRRYPDFLAIFGAGNSGPGPGSLTSEANSKNALVVGASVSPRPAMDFSAGETRDPAQFSSRGPAGDGRIKPDLLAPGTSVISARSSLVKGNLPGFPEYARMQGTSMASAVAAGSVALLREYMQREMAMADPRASSVKAALINGASAPDPGPSREVFGVLDLAGTVMALKENAMFLAEENQGLPEGGTKTYTYVVEDPGTPLKVTLAWTDPAGDPASANTLVNNLDLTVTAPDGKKYYGNSFLGPTPDTLNNVEQVYVKNPLPGEYLIEVRAASVKSFAARNTTDPAQDYSLACGQPLATGLITEVKPGGALGLNNGHQLDPSGKNVRYIFNGATASGMKPAPGYRVYYSSRSVYIAGRLWKPESARHREGIGGRIWYEAGQDALEGGYYQNPEAGKGLTVNGALREDISGLPPGIGLEAALDGRTQTLWRPATSYRTKTGNVGRAVPGESGSITSIDLFNEKRGYRVSPGASYIYNDTFEGADPLEGVFGSGNLDGLYRILPGQNVTLVMSPASRVVNSVLVDRSIISGYVTGVNPGADRITMGDNEPFHVIAGAGVQKNRAGSTLMDIVPGDYAVAVVLPGSREILGLAAYSNVVYGRVLFTSARDRSVYMNDFQNRFQVYRLSPDTEVRRWGLITDASTLSSGTWVRTTLSPDRTEVWRMDVAELLEDEQKELAAVEGLYVITTDGQRYLASETFTAITKDGLPVAVGDLLPGEKITLVSLLAPAPHNKAPVAIRARSPEGSKKPVLAAAVRENNGQYVLSGFTSGDRVYIWHENGIREDLPVQKDTGGFSAQLRFFENESTVKIVSVNSGSGGVAGKTVNRAEVVRRQFTDTAGHWGKEDIAKTVSDGIMAGYGDGAFRPDRPVTGAELSMIWAGLTGTVPANPGDPNQVITRSSFMVTLKKTLRNAVKTPKDYKLSFTDCERITEAEREAIAWGRYWGVITGRSRDFFDPGAPLTRAEVAAIIQRVLEKLSTY